MHTTSGVSPNVFLYLLAILSPPIAVFIAAGCGPDLLINVILTVLGWLFGFLHAWYVISKLDRTIAIAGPIAPLATASVAPATGTVPLATKSKH